MGSVEKEKKTERSSSPSTGIPSNPVDKPKNVDILSTKPKFKGDRQRVRKDQLEKLSEIATKYGRRSFSDVIDLLISCYEFLEGISRRHNLTGVSAAMEFVEKILPQNDVEMIRHKVVELLEGVGINGEDYLVLEQELISILLAVKRKKRSAREIFRPLILMRRG